MSVKLEWVLFDADNTLFYFDAFSGLKRLFKKYEIYFSPNDYDQYQSLNTTLWIDYQNNSISLLQLQHYRFEGWANRLGVTTYELHNGFLKAMGEISNPLPGAGDLLSNLYGKVKIGIITNGFTALQETRIRRNCFSKYFNLLIVSEQVGYAKPNPEIFNFALNKMSNPSRHRVLMVGDNPDSDIIGGINAGFSTCWLNHDGRTKPHGINPDWQVTSLRELQDLLEGSLRNADCNQNLLKT
ncbi:Pyrimidine 5'-nucleotidase YjjG [Candidatus Erwinia haradaeae]|uniref:Pyrimidine 5'-nucleotidase YjjG n=1 Tax=Candidatus Erwinia haradaeae TaxID=1922217 RepID=A0A451DJM5_9GAMM|nr:pyrimidine 5'-nucleotidase [Candidatus Erwinia haradaeae]VFP86927.1 Pyrimidine 5'-nucleotidase YjjG [Candidatus Erwinia haradaeae]